MNISFLHSLTLNIRSEYSAGKCKIASMSLPPELFNAAHDEFASNGYKATSIAAIARRAGIAVGSVYLHCNSKYELFREIYQETNTQQKQQLAAEIDWSEPKSALMAYIDGINVSLRNNKILAEWLSDDPGAKLRNDCGCEGEIFCAEQLAEWRAKGAVNDEISDELLYELVNAVRMLDTGNTLSPQAMRFLIQAVLNEVFATDKE